MPQSREPAVEPDREDSRRTLMDMFSNPFDEERFTDSGWWQSLREFQSNRQESAPEWMGVAANLINHPAVQLATITPDPGKFFRMVPRASSGVGRARVLENMDPDVIEFELRAGPRERAASGTLVVDRTQGRGRPTVWVDELDLGEMGTRESAQAIESIVEETVRQFPNVGEVRFADEAFGSFPIDEATRTRAVQTRLAGRDIQQFDPIREQFLANARRVEATQVSPEILAAMRERARGVAESLPHGTPARDHYLALEAFMNPEGAAVLESLTGIHPGMLAASPEAGQAAHILSQEARALDATAVEVLIERLLRGMR